MRYNSKTLFQIKSPPRQIGHHFADGMFKCIFLNENIWVSNKIYLKYVPRGLIDTMFIDAYATLGGDELMIWSYTVSPITNGLKMVTTYVHKIASVYLNGPMTYQNSLCASIARLRNPRQP